MTTDIANPKITIPLEKATGGRYIIKLDASLYSNSSCLRKLYYTGIRGLRTEGRDFKMEYGTAFHKAMQVWYATKNKEDALDIAIKHYSDPTIHIPETDWRDIGHLVATLTQYFKHYKADGLEVAHINEKPLLEQRFAVPYTTDKRLVDVILCGTIDMIGTLNGMPVICDHKTTSMASPDNYLAAYNLSPQLMFYTYIYHKLFPDEKRGSIINGIFLSRTGKTKFKRSPIIEFTDEMINNFETHLQSIINTLMTGVQKIIKGHSIEEIFSTNFNCCNAKFGICKYAPLCTTPGQYNKESIIDTMFETLSYNPLNFQK